MKAKLVEEVINEAVAEEKDLMRIRDIITKSKGNKEKELQLSRNMAKSITDPSKASRRSDAADQILGKDNPIYDIFNARALELGGDSPQKEIKQKAQTTSVINIPKENPKVKESELKKGQYSTSYYKGVIFLSTFSAIALWDWEITGQLSDGAWENSKPDDHYKFWCELESRIGQPEVQSSGWPKKLGYNLAGLIEYVGDRMVKYGRFGRAVGLDIFKIGNSVRSIVEDFPETENGLFEEFTEDSDPIKDMNIGGSLRVWKEKMINKSSWRKDETYWRGLTQKHVDAYYATKYDMKDLRKDLIIIKEAMHNVHGISY
jgi:hypothetical protein